MLSEDLLGAKQQSEITSSITGATNKPKQMSISEDNIIPTNFTMQGCGVVALAPTMLPNDLFTQLANNLVKGLDNIVQKGNSPKKKQAAKKAVSVAPAKRSEKQEQRSSVLGDIKNIRAEQAQDKPEHSHQRTKTKSNNMEI